MFRIGFGDATRAVEPQRIPVDATCVEAQRWSHVQYTILAHPVKSG